jgi:serine/threonine protein kinase/tetratricopeptide (TPR) repeat protein
MRPDDDTPLEEELVPLLAACDEALAAGVSAASSFCNGETPEMRQRLERDLACVHMLRQLWTAQPAVQPSGELPFTRLGRFEIRRELGQGGYGIVFLAWDPQLGREVALKVPRADILVTPDLRERFRQEARAAAGLDHPHIVPVFDAGEVGPISFIASAYCPGITLAQWLRERAEPVSWDEAAALVATLADAVQHAHSRGVLHRDLKPANVLLQTDQEKGRPGEGEEGRRGDKGTTELSPSRLLPVSLSGLVPKIADFGLAKIVTGTPATATRSGAVVGTPSYMAPEQARGESKSISTAADVYGLGAILYELLTGRPPFEAGTALETLLQVMNAEPVPPRRLRPKLPRDLETVCFKCLQKEPGRRYASAVALADDLHHFLAREPVLARPVGTGERLWRWCRRKPALAGMAASLFVVLLCGAAGVGWQWLRAERNARDAEAKRQKAYEAIHDYFTRVSENKLLGKPGMQGLRKELLESALHYYQEFLHDWGDDAAMRAEVAATHACVAVILDQTGAKDEARLSLEAALALYEKLAQANPGDLEAQRGLARTYNQLGDLYARMAALDQAQDRLDQARKVLEKLVAGHHDAPELQSELAKTHRHVAAVRSRAGQRAAALEALESAAAIGRRLVQDYPKRPQYALELSATYNARGDLHTAAGEFRQARSDFSESRDLVEPLARRQPTDTDLQSKLADIQAGLTNALNRSGQLAEALRMWQEVRDLRERLAYENPLVIEFQWNLAVAYSYLGKQHSQVKEFPQALALWQQALALVEKLLRINPGFPDYRLRLADLHNDNGHVYSKMGRQADTLKSFEQAGLILEALVRDCPDTATYVHALAINRHNYGNELRQIGRRDEARPCLERSRELCLQLIAEDARALAYPFLLVHVYNQLGILRLDAKEPEQAAQSFREAMELSLKLHGSQPEVEVPLYEQLLATCYANQGEAARAANQPAQARDHYRQALAIREKLVAKHAAMTDVIRQAAEASRDLAAVEREAGRLPEALALYDQARDYCVKAFKANALDLRAQSVEGETWDGTGLILAELKRSDEAVKAHRQAIDLQKIAFDKEPAQTLYRERLDTHLQNLARLHRDLGQPAEAVSLALQRQELWRNQPAKLFAVACDLASCVPLVGKGKSDLTPQEQTDRDKYAEQALTALAEAVARGFKDGKQLRAEPALQGIRERASFQKLLRDVEGSKGGS